MWTARPTWPGSPSGPAAVAIDPAAAIRSGVAAAALALSCTCSAGVVTPFSAGRPGGLPPVWQPYALRDDIPRTHYELVESDGRVVLRARATASASALVHRLMVDSSQVTRLHWQWRVDRLAENADMLHKNGDDFAARVYVLFDLPAERLGIVERATRSVARWIYGDEPPLAALCYVWSNRYPIGTEARNPYSARVHTIVVESGPEKLHRWQHESRDIAADYRRAFGTDPPGIVGIVVAADTDDTGASAEAYFGDIELEAPAGS